MSGQPSSDSLKNRRYVANKETASYVIFDASENINAGVFGTRYNIDLLKINLNLYTILSLINGIWDIINDTFTGPIVDKTRTRWGKFRPYLIAFAGPSLFFTILQWSLPFFLDTKNEYDMTKFFFFLAIQISNEAIATFRDISKTGLLSSMTPNPIERVRLLTMAKWISSIFDNIPKVLLSVVYDAMNNGLIKISNKRVFYGSIGIVSAIISTCMAMFFFLNAKERVTQSEKKPSIMEGIRTIIHNRPAFLLMLNDLLGAFSLSTGQENYFIDVLGYNSFGTLTELPSIVSCQVSYTYIGAMRKRFSSRFLWILSSNYDNFQRILVFLLGCIGGKGKNGWYRDPKKMFMIIAPLEFIRKSFWGVRQVVPQEITYEAIDYCEWKNGYRSEGVIIITKGLMSKIVRNATSGIQASILNAIGYSLKQGFGKQGDSTKFGLFATAFLLPGVTGAFSIIPKLMYKLGSKEKELMYSELMERRYYKEAIKQEIDTELSQETTE
ncbi:MAG: MFS transporter [Eubacteriales bacterium]